MIDWLLLNIPCYMHQIRWRQLMKGSNFPAYRKGTVVGVTIFLKDLLSTAFSAEYVMNSIFCVNELYMELVCFKRGTHTKSRARCWAVLSYLSRPELFEPQSQPLLWACCSLQLYWILNVVHRHSDPLYEDGLFKKGRFSSRCPSVFPAPLGTLEVSYTSFNSVSFCLCSFCWEIHTCTTTVSFW